MKGHIEIWKFIADRLRRAESVVLLVVAESNGSSPGRACYKMAVGIDGELSGTIGGGVMEVNLVERSRGLLTQGKDISTVPAHIFDQVHQRHSPEASGMICSGQQTVILKVLTAADLAVVDRIVEIDAPNDLVLTLTPMTFALEKGGGADSFEAFPNGDFRYIEQLDKRDRLIIVGGGHCALALSEVMARLDFQISIFDDRPGLNTIAKNRFADAVTLVDSYDKIAEMIPASSDDTYIAVMTLGYQSDEAVIRSLFDRNFKYFGVLGSKAKMATLLRELRSEGFNDERLKRIHTPIGLKINSRTPAEIAISIAAEIIALRNR